MKNWETYKNGNYLVRINTKNGTKIRICHEDEFKPEFAENCDVKITNQCNLNCPMCHEASCSTGKHGDILNAKFIDSLHPWTELAIGGGDVTSHPDLVPFLRKLKEKNVIANITVNQVHFEEKQELIKQLVDEKLIYGLGVSLVSTTDKFIELIKQYPTAVIHVINGIVDEKNLSKLYDHNLKILILGYKEFRKGIDYFSKENIIINEKKQWLYDNLAEITNRFEVVSFDNLGIAQLEVNRLMSKEDWDEFYMGDDGTMTFYIDIVESKFASSSTSNIRYNMLDNIDDMFKIIKEAKDGIK